MVDAIWEATDDGTLLVGWDMVAKHLRQALVEHAADRGCRCGSVSWLEEERLRNVSLGEE
jgi:hypothetical protein